MKQLLSFLPCLSTHGPAAVVAAVAVALVASGCDKAGDIVDSVSETVSEQAETVAETVTEQVETVTEPAEPAAPQIEPAADPQALLQELYSTPSNQITDSLLQRVAATPDAAAQVIELRLDGAKLSLAGIATLPTLPNLQLLTLKGVRLAATDFEPISKSASIQTLDLSSTLADGSVVEMLVAMPTLKSLTLDKVPTLQPGSGPVLARMNLEVLSLEKVAFNDSDAAAIAGSAIRSLNLSGTQLTDAGLAEVAKIETLEELNVSRTVVRGPAFQVLANSGLKSLDASQTVFGSVGLQAIQGMKHLETLRLAQAEIIEDENADVFRKLPALKTLVLSQNKISDAGVKQFFSGHKTLEHLELQAIPTISDYSLGFLVKNRALKYLDVHGGTKCSLNGTKLFNQKRPDCFIYSDYAQLGPTDSESE